jgi:hypothetical protein
MHGPHRPATRREDFPCQQIAPPLGHAVVLGDALLYLLGMSGARARLFVVPGITAVIAAISTVIFLSKAPEPLEPHWTKLGDPACKQVDNSDGTKSYVPGRTGEVCDQRDGTRWGKRRMSATDAPPVPEWIVKVDGDRMTVDERRARQRKWY